MFKVRQAVMADIPALRRLIELSVRRLQAGDYTPQQIEGALGTLLGVDTRLIEDGTYLVAETEVNGEPGLVACGGWSRRKTLFGSDHRAGREDDLLDPHNDAARIRAFFVHPSRTRRGLGNRILEICESEARAAGFTRFEMGATLTGVPLYAARGYVPLERIEVPLPNGAALPIVRMTKEDRA